MITPLARRRPAKVARETATLDRLSPDPPLGGMGGGSYCRNALLLQENRSYLRRDPTHAEGHP